MNKRINYSLFFALIFLILTVILCVDIGAASSYFDKNEALALEKYEAISALKVENAKLGGAGKRANDHIIVYEQKINAITDEALVLKETADLIVLYYEQGAASGKLALIYYTYIDDVRLTAADLDVLEKIHSELQNEIATATDASSVSNAMSASYSSNGLSARMYVSIYNKLLDNLIIDGDSQEVYRKVSVAKEEIKSCTLVTESARYEEIYNRALVDVGVRRNKDNATAEIKALHSILFPNKDIIDNDAAMAAIDYIGRDSTVSAKDMNSYMKNAIESFLSGKKTGEKYTDAFIGSLSEAIAARIANADKKGELASLTSVLDDFWIKYQRAKAKDIIANDISGREYGGDEKMTALEKAYNAPNGIIDKCGDQASLDFDIKRASVRADIYGRYVYACQKIMGYGEFPELIEEAGKKYDYYDLNVLQIDITADGAEYKCVAEYEAASKELQRLIDSSEIRAYKSKYAAVLEKTPADIVLDDRDMLLAAISELETVYEGTLAALESDGTVNALAEQYKAYTRLSIDKTLGEANDLRKTLASDLKKKTDKLTANGLGKNMQALMLNADRLVDKANEAERVLASYEKLLSDDVYVYFAESDKVTLKNIASEATANIANADASEDLRKASEGAILGLERANAYAIIDAKVAARNDLKAENKEDIDKLADEGKKNVRDLLSAADIKNATNKTIFEIQKVMDKNDITVDADKANEIIDELGFIDTKEAATFRSELAIVLAEEKKALAYASDENERRAVLDRFENRVSSILVRAEAVNYEAASEKRKTVRDELSIKYGEAEALLAALAFLTDERKAVLGEEFENIIKDIDYALNSAHNEKQLSSVRTNAIDLVAEFADKAEKEDKAAEEEIKISFGSEIRSKYAALIEKINDFAYLSDSEKDILKAEAKKAYDKFESSIVVAEGLCHAKAIRDEAYDALSLTDSMGSENNLSSAKANALATVNINETDVKTLLGLLEHISAEQKNSLLAELEGNIENAREKIEAADSAEDVEKARNSASKKAINIEKRAKALDDKALVSALTPALIFLSVICAIEIIDIAALLWVKKKFAQSEATPMIAPSLALVLTPVSTKIFIILLAVADVLMAIYVVYLVVVVWKAFARLRKKTGLSQTAESIEIEGARAEDDIEEYVAETGTCLDEDDVAEGILEYEPEFIIAPIQMEEITVEEANEMMSDEEAKGFEQLAIAFDTGDEPKEIYHGTRKAEINRDTISQNFEAGDVVTLNTLKEKKLVSVQAGEIKVLARGKLDKALTVVAQSFSAAAVKMIVLTGGTVIVDEPSPERRKK